MTTAPFNTTGGYTGNYPPATYGAAGVGLTLYSTAAAVLVEVQGSATKTVRVRKITLWAQAGTKFYTEVELLRSTTLAATGTPVPAALGKYDTNNPTATAVVNSYAGAATFGTGHILVGAGVLAIAAPAAGLNPQPLVWEFGQSGSYNGRQPMDLRGTGDVLQVYNTILTLGTATFGFEVVWDEDNLD